MTAVTADTAVNAEGGERAQVRLHTRPPPESEPATVRTRTGLDPWARWVVRLSFHLRFQGQIHPVALFVNSSDFAAISSAILRSMSSAVTRLFFSA